MTCVRAINSPSSLNDGVPGGYTTNRAPLSKQAQISKRGCVKRYRRKLQEDLFGIELGIVCVLDQCRLRYDE